MKPEFQLAFLSKLQRLFAEGDFTATYKFALLIALADLSVEVGRDDNEPLKLPYRSIGLKLIQLYWQQAVPFTGGAILMQGLGVKPEVVYADLGYRGVDKDNPHIEIKHRGKDKRLTDDERRLLKRRHAIEPIIGHLKADHRMDRCHLKGTEGDALHAVLCAAGYNTRWLMRMIVKKGLGLLLCLRQASGLTGLFGKLAEIFGLKRLQNSGQRWALA